MRGYCWSFHRNNSRVTIYDCLFVSIFDTKWLITYLLSMISLISLWLKRITLFTTLVDSKYTSDGTVILKQSYKILFYPGRWSKTHYTLPLQATCNALYLIQWKYYGNKRKIPLSFDAILMPIYWDGSQIWGYIFRDTQSWKSSCTIL